jgi:hypothetical protein
MAQNCPLHVIIAWLMGVDVGAGAGAGARRRRSSHVPIMRRREVTVAVVRAGCRASDLQVGGPGGFNVRRSGRDRAIKSTSGTSGCRAPPPALQPEVSELPQHR